ncbi:MAG: hypothetical protein SCALA702_06530 [Melioribacteraceae bacterium]|nr:MAG: hypothetical protein SCALA702_06530 [Melioribacteraceae bacterium]
MKNPTDVKIKFIGTSSGVTSADRFHSSFVIESGESKILIDAGDSVCKALLNSGYKFTDITDIIFTHFHADHVSGIAPLLTQMKIIGRTEPLRIFCPAGLIASLEYYLEMTNLFAENFGYQFSIIPMNERETLSIGNGISTHFIKNTHIQPKALTNRKYDIPFLSGSLLIRTDAGNIFYTSDVCDASDLQLFGNNQIDLFISETAHVSLDDIVEAWLKSGAKKLILTHYEDEQYDTLKQFTSTSYPAGKLAETAYDGMETFLTSQS